MQPIADVAQTLHELEVDPAVIRRVVRILEDGTQQLETSDFPDLALPPGAFGGSDPGRDLGTHHALAHAVVVDTLVGLSSDLARFRSGVEDAVSLVLEADETAAADLDQRRARAASILAAVASRSVADERNLQARAEHLGGVDETGGGV